MLRRKTNEKMVPRLRQRVCLETLRRELQLVDVSAPSPSPSLAVKDSWKGSFRVEIDDDCDFATTDSQAVGVGDKIPGFRTSAGMHKAHNLPRLLSPATFRAFSNCP